MEEIKDIENSGVVIIPQNNQTLPETNTEFSRDADKAERAHVPSSGRISNFLTGNMILTKDTLVKKFDNEYKLSELLPPEVTDEEGNTFKPIDREGNLIKLTAMQNRVIISLSKQIFSKNTEEVNNYMEAIKRGDNPKNRPRMYVVLSTINEDLFGEQNKKEAETSGEFSGDLVTLSDMSGDVFGAEHKGKPSKVGEIYKELQEIAKIRVPMVYAIGTFKDKKGEEHKVAYRDLIPYITITGYEKQLLIDDKIYSAIEIEPSRIFYEKNWIGKGSRSFLLGKDTLGARLPSGRKIQTDVYWCGLFPLAASYSWHAYYINLKKVEKQIAEENIIDSVRIAQLKEDALTTKPITFQRIRDAINFQSKHPQEEARFRKQLWEGIWALIDRGIVTEKSSINWDKETFTLVFSEEREALDATDTRTRGEHKPRGEWAKYDPQRKRGRKKGSSKKTIQQYGEQTELFPKKV